MSDPTRPSWHDDAYCSTEHPDIYVTDNLPDSNMRAHYARKLCDGCPVTRECAIDALNYDTRGVVRAGYAWPEDTRTVWTMRRRVGKRFNVPVPRLEVEVERARRTVCKNGHEMVPENVRIRSSDGARLCVTCRRASELSSRRAAQARAKAAA